MRQELCKSVDKHFPRLPNELREPLVQFLAAIEELHIKSLKSQHSAEHEIAIAEEARRFCTVVLRGGEKKTKKVKYLEVVK